MARYPNFPTFGIRPLDFERLLNSSNITYRAIFKRADLCPCFDVTRGSPEYTCPVCGGIGRAWTTPALTHYEDALLRGSTRWPERASRALIEPGSATVRFTSADGLTFSFIVDLDEDGSVIWPPYSEPGIGTPYRLAYRAPEQGRLHAQGITKRRDLEDRGMVVAGQMDVSIPRYYEDLTTPNPAWQAAEHDRFVFPDLKHRHQARLVRGRNERLTYALTHEITSVRAIDGSSIAHYALGTDLTIDADGRVTWADPLTLPASTPYVVDYVAAPEYYVWQELPQQRHIDGHDLPRRVSLRLFEQYPHRT